MGKAFPGPIPPDIRAFISSQHVFFVGTAPLSPLHRVNVSPKSSSQLHVPPCGTVLSYLDLTGSGNETAAHIAENGRLTLMFVALEGNPQIVRVFGTGEVRGKETIREDDPVLSGFAPEWVRDVGFRAVVVLRVERVSTSCGYSIPKFDYVKERNTLTEVTAKLGLKGIEEYRAKKNYLSIDGLDGFNVVYVPSAKVPTRIEIENGFPFAYYDGKVSRVLKMKAWIHTMRCWVKMRNRDGRFSFLVGLVVGLMLERLLKFAWKRNLR